MSFAGKSHAGTLSRDCRRRLPYVESSVVWLGGVARAWTIVLQADGAAFVPRFAANLSTLWQELEPYDRFRAAAQAGFKYVEALFPHELDTQRLERLLRKYELQLVLFDSAAGDWKAGERGLLSVPGRENDLAATVRDAIRLAVRTGTKNVNVLAGIPPVGIGSEEAAATVLRNLRAVAPLAHDAGITLLIEGINTIDVPGYWAPTVSAAAELVQSLDDENIRLQLDQYHAAMAGEDPVVCLRAYRGLIRHVQIADAPGRHEPGTGSLPIPEFLRELDRVGYEGHVGLEYRPLRDTAASLRWLDAAGL